MNDDTPPWENKPAKQTVLDIHWCMHKDCKKWGSFGYSTRYGQLWLCLEHKEEGEQAMRNAQT